MSVLRTVQALSLKNPPFFTILLYGDSGCFGLQQFARQRLQVWQSRHSGFIQCTGDSHRLAQGSSHPKWVKHFEFLWTALPTGEKLINKKQLFSNSIGDLVEAGRRVVVPWLIAVSWILGQEIDNCKNKPTVEGNNWTYTKRSLFSGAACPKAWRSFWKMLIPTRLTSFPVKWHWRKTGRLSWPVEICWAVRIGCCKTYSLLPRRDATTWCKRIPTTRKARCMKPWTATQRQRPISNSCEASYRICQTSFFRPKRQIPRFRSMW